MLPNCHALIKEFSEREGVPVELEDVVEAVKKRGAKDEIYYWLEADLDPTILMGALEEWEYPDEEGKLHYVAHVDCAKSLPGDWKRLVVCKELLHLLDPPVLRVHTEAEFEHLCHRLGLPPEDQDIEKDGDKTISDRLGTYKAIAVLFPYAVREIFMPKYQANLISYEDIAKIVDVPARYAALVMSDHWATLHAIFIKDFSDGS